MNLLADGAYAIEDKISIPGEGISPFVFCAGWLLEIIEVESGEFSFFHDSLKVRPCTKYFGAFYPSFTIVRSYVKEFKGQVRGIGSIKSMPSLPSEPEIFETDFRERFSSIAQAEEVLASRRNRQSIDVNSRSSLLSIKAKRLIDENYLVYPSIARIANRLGVSHAHLSRQFKRDYWMSPSEYLHRLRVAEATFRLLVGEEIVDISHDVGYNDLSRFYKQFRKKMMTSPAACRSILRKPT